MLQLYCLNFETLTGMCFETFPYLSWGNQLHQMFYPYCQNPEWSSSRLLKFKFCYILGNTWLSWWSRSFSISLPKPTFPHLPCLCFTIYKYKENLPHPPLEGFYGGGIWVQRSEQWWNVHIALSLISGIKERRLIGMFSPFHF